MKSKINKIKMEIKTDLIKFVKDIIRIKSYTGEEKQLALFIKEKMQKLGYDNVIVDKLGNVIGVIGNGETEIFYDAHIDTVEVSNDSTWSVDPFGGEIRNGCIYGRGSADMKGAVAAIVYAGYAMKKLGLCEGKKIYISTSVMEEDYVGEAVNSFLKEYKIYPDYAIICEPSSLKLALGHKGRAVLKVEVNGISAHGSAPENGVNSVYKMRKIIERVERLGNDFMKAKGRKGSLALTKINSNSVSLNAIPDKCSIYLDRRLIEGESKKYVLEEIRNLFCEIDASLKIYQRYGTSWTGEDILLNSFSPPWEISLNHILTKACQRSFKELYGKNPEKIKWDFSTNGLATAGKHNIPTIGFGPGDPKLAHKIDENCPLSDILNAFKFYINLINYL